MSNDCGSVDTDDCTKDEEVNCVFCGKLFSSIERVQEHITETHESVETNTDHVEVKTECSMDKKPLRIYDLNTELIVNNAIDYNNIVQCSKCDLLFINAYASRMHFEKVHLGRKRKRSSNPNGVEGIIVSPNGSDNWGCDICGRQFPTLKQAKVHKFKSHIEPVQKKKLLIHRNILRKNTVTQRNYAKKLITDNKFREILPNSKKSKIDNSQTDLSSSQRCQDDTENGSHSDHNNQGSYTASGTGIPTTNLWRAAQAQCRGNKIVISRVYQSEAFSVGIARTKYGLGQRSGYNCFYCREIFLNRENFKRHLLLHRGNKCYNCRNCGGKFLRIRILKQHQRLNCHAESPTQSNVLDINEGPNLKTEISTIAQKTVERELPRIVKTESLTPNFVNVSSKDEEILPKDIKFAEKFLNNSSITLNKGSQCVCNLCQSCFYSNNSILRHLVLYHRIAAQDGSTPLTIKLDPSHHKSRPSLNDNGNDSSNLNPKPSLNFIHNCDQCGSQFASKKGLQRHLYSVHFIQSHDLDDGTQPEVACSECSVVFGDVLSFEDHKEECHGLSSSLGALSRRVKCDICGRRFRNPLTLDEHKKMHVVMEEEMDSKANVFSIITPNDGSVFCTPRTEEKVKHRDSSSHFSKKSLSYSVPAYKKAKVPPNSEGLFECDVCHKTFTCRSSLSNHVKSHFNFKNKPFSCSSCKQGFMSTLTLQHHREQLCPNMSTTTARNMSTSDFTKSSIGPVVSTAQAPVFSSFDGVSQVSGNSNLTTRATSCMHCSAMFPDRSLLEDHASKEHSNHAGEVVCIICPRSFTTYMAFRVHMTKSHGGPNGTSLKSHLNSTASVHKPNTSFDLIHELSKEPPPRASLVTTNGQIYHHHHQNHSRHACPNCDKDFSTSQALGNHKRACMPHLYKKVSMGTGSPMVYDDMSRTSTAIQTKM